MPVTEKRRCGEAFRRPLDLDAFLGTLADVSGKVTEQVRHGLTTGVLVPKSRDESRGEGKR
jgi:hypothetical protein